MGRPFHSLTNRAPNAQREKRRLYDGAPRPARTFDFALVWRHRLRGLLGGVYTQQPFDYAIYTPDSPGQRVARHVSKPTFLWKSRLQSIKATMERKITVAVVHSPVLP